MSSKIIDITGQRFGRLLVIGLYGRVPSGEQFKTMWNCKCDCGNEKVISGAELKNGHTNSCGCLHKEMFGNINRKHNLAHKCKLYRIWKSIKYTPSYRRNSAPCA